jgi:hypothetical protein
MTGFSLMDKLGTNLAEEIQPTERLKGATLN